MRNGTLKRREFIRELLDNGYILERSGGKHDIYVHLEFGTHIAVPRHTEIKAVLHERLRKEMVKSHTSQIKDIK